MRGRFVCIFARRSARASRKRPRSATGWSSRSAGRSPADDLCGISDNIGFPNSGINVTLSNSGVIGTADAEILISLTPDHRTKPVDYMRTLRQTLPREFPGTEFYFQPADIVSQVLNFGLPAPIDVQLTGPNVDQNYDLARTLLPRLQAVPGAVDVHIQQGYDQPQLDITVDRTKAAAGRDDADRGRQQRPGVAVQQLYDRAELLGQPSGRHVQRRHADAAIPHGFMYSALQGMPVIGGGGRIRSRSS